MGEPMRVAAVILAAGASTRFGSQKQVARVGDRTMLEAVVAVARGAGLSPVVAVVPPRLAVPADVVPVINGQPDLGISRSLQLGIRALPPEIQAAVILLGDQPTMSADLVRAVVDAERDGRPVVAARAEGHAGPPVLLLREAFELTAEATGDAGLAPFLAAHPNRARFVDVVRHVPDVDTLADMDQVTD